MPFGYKGLGKNRRKVDLCSIRVGVNCIMLQLIKQSYCKKIHEYHMYFHVHMFTSSLELSQKILQRKSGK